MRKIKIKVSRLAKKFNMLFKAMKYWRKWKVARSNEKVARSNEKVAGIVIADLRIRVATIPQFFEICNCYSG